MTTSNTVELVIRVHNVDPDTPIELTQEEVMDALYRYGFSRIEPVSTTLVSPESYDAC